MSEANEDCSKEELLSIIKNLREELNEKEEKMKWIVEERDALLEKIETLNLVTQQKNQILSLVQDESFIEESPLYLSSLKYDESVSFYPSSSPSSSPSKSSLISSSSSLSSFPSGSNVAKQGESNNNSPINNYINISEPVLKSDSSKSANSPVKIIEFKENQHAKTPEEMLEQLKLKRENIDKNIMLIEQLVKQSKKKKQKRTEKDGRKTRSNTIDSIDGKSEDISVINKEYEQNELEESKEIVDGKMIILGGTVQQLVNRLAGASAMGNPSKKNQTFF